MAADLQEWCRMDLDLYSYEPVKNVYALQAHDLVQTIAKAIS